MLNRHCGQALSSSCSRAHVVVADVARGPARGCTVMPSAPASRPAAPPAADRDAEVPRALRTSGHLVDVDAEKRACGSVARIMAGRSAGFCRSIISWRVRSGDDAAMVVQQRAQHAASARACAARRPAAIASHGAIVQRGLQRQPARAVERRRARRAPPRCRRRHQAVARPRSSGCQRQGVQVERQHADLAQQQQLERAQRRLQRRARRGASTRSVAHRHRTARGCAIVARQQRSSNSLR